PPLDLPEGERRVGRDLVTAPRVVHEQIQTALFRLDSVEHDPNLAIVRMVAADRDPRPPAGGDLLRRLIDRAWSSERRRLAPHAPAGDVDGRSPLTEHERDPLAASAARPGHQGDVPVGRTFAHGKNHSRAHLVAQSSSWTWRPAAETDFRPLLSGRPDSNRRPSDPQAGS